METRMEMRQEMNLAGGATSSVFPSVERWLDADADRMRALEFVSSRKNMDRYQSVMDFLFCEIFFDQQRRCFNYYKGKGGQLKDFASRTEIAQWQRVLLIAVKHAYRMYCEKRVTSWTTFRAEVLRAAA